MDFFGENLLPGKLGHLFILLSLISSLAATFAYFKSTQKNIDADKLQWKNFARAFFIAEAISVFAIFCLLVFIISNHLFEYKYAWQHSSKSLEMKYLLSSLWEGQEGSFLLWSVWHCVLGLVIIKKETRWEAPVMTIVSLVQFSLATMLAGLYFFGAKIGSNPFVLLRNEMDAPIFSQANYLSFIQDGNDLNPLLQNYWMVIHPPILFLGFAATTIPFAYAIAGLWTKQYKEWTRPALPWALFAAAVLGLGVMMGARWAYESLTFGGYWAWDPVENASLVPWLVLVAGIHTLLIFRHTGNALRPAFFFLIMMFVLVWYSTYLTRSGILQNTSVHAFNPDNAVEIQLRLLLLIFTAGSMALFVWRYKEIPFVAKEEEASSREFWMFVGSLVLFLSAITIIAMTSVPVFNKIIGLFTGKDKEVFKPLAFGEDAEFAYNRIQIFVAVIIGFLTAISQYFKYGATPKQFFINKILWPSIVSVVIASLILLVADIKYSTYGMGYLGAVWLAAVSSVYAVIANASYIWLGMKGRLKVSGGSIAHVGFGLMLAGILISSSKKEVLSHNTSGIFVNFGEKSNEKPGENLTLIQGVRTDMGKYWVTYEKDSAHPKKPLWFYQIKFERKDGNEKFTLSPNAFVNYKGNEGLMANPDAKHYWDHDVFTYITSLPDPEKNKDTSSFTSQKLRIGDTAFYSKGFVVLEKLITKTNIPRPNFSPDDSASVATIKVYAKTNSIYTSEPLLINQRGRAIPYPDTVAGENLIIQLQKAGTNYAELGIKESSAVMKYLTLKAYKFPFINVLWLGTIIMVAGFIISIARRVQQNRVKALKI
ncbi:MAG: cytochrome c biogenesis protein CcsA [Chitinophagaceae bacterium]|nr:cytochrome c biogenesis protein CcsA [Chitinophagaceae bacterium]